MKARSLTKPEAIDLARRFIAYQLPAESWYQYCLPHIVAILLYGSAAKGTNRPDSDVDILILMPLSIEELYTAGEYFYDYNDHAMNIVIRSIERLREIASVRDDPFQREVFRDSVILAAATDEIGHLLHSISAA